MLLENGAMAMLMLSAAEKTTPGDYFGLGKRIHEIKEGYGGSLRIDVKRNACGYYSPSLDSFVGVFEIAGEVGSRDTLELNEDGVKSCEDIIKYACSIYPEDMKKIAEVMGFDLKEHCMKAAD